MHITDELRAVTSIGERFSAQRNEVQRALLSERIGVMAQTTIYEINNYSRH